MNKINKTPFTYSSKYYESKFINNGCNEMCIQWKIK